MLAAGVDRKTGAWLLSSVVQVIGTAGHEMAVTHTVQGRQ